MIGHREITVDDVTSILRRRMWWIIVPTVIAPFISYAISLKLPNRYSSQALLLVEQQKVPSSFVHPVVTEDLNMQLATMQERVLSRTRLQPLIERVGLYQDQTDATMEDKVEMLRHALAISPVQSELVQAGGLPGFYIRFTASNAKMAQTVCAEITGMFIQENVKVREQAAQGTTEFLRTQLDESKRKLDEQDAKLADFKRKHFNEMPGQEQTTLSVLGSLSSQLDATTQAISQMEQQKTYAQTLLAQQLQSWENSQSTNTTPQTLEQQLAAAQAQLTSLQAKYTPTHPDVIKTQHDVAVLKKMLEDSYMDEAKPDATKVASKSRARTEPMQIQQMRLQLKMMDQAIADKKKQQTKLQQQVNQYQARLQLTPAIEEEYKQLTRDYQTALEFYNDLLRKESQASMGTDLELKQQGEQFRLMDPATLPQKPTFPNRQSFAAGGLAGGLGLGLAIALLFEYRDKSLRNELDIQALLEIPTIAQLPTTGTSNNGFRLSKHRQVADQESHVRVVGA